MDNTKHYTYLGTWYSDDIHSDYLANYQKAVNTDGH